MEVLEPNKAQIDSLQIPEDDHHLAAFPASWFWMEYRANNLCKSRLTPWLTPVRLVAFRQTLQQEQKDSRRLFTQLQ